MLRLASTRANNNRLRIFKKEKQIKKKIKKMQKVKVIALKQLTAKERRNLFSE